MATVCYAIVLPGPKSTFWAAFGRTATGTSPPRPAGRPISVLSRSQSGQNPARKADFLPGNTIAKHRIAMDATKPCKFIWFGAMYVTKPYKFIRFGAMDVTKPY
jgi:hypothetical protein